MLGKISGAKITPLSFLAVLSTLLFFANLAFASETVGTINGTSKYAWGENTGWINFGCDHCNVSITDTGLSGRAWSTQYGWINLNPNLGGNAGVLNTSAGVLSGFAWGSNLGWINFTGVTIDSNGEFLGYATVKSDNSRINFNCINGNSCSSADFKVKTDWRPANARTQGGSSGGHLPPVSPPPIPPPVITNPVLQVADNIGATINSLYNSLFSFFKPKNIPENTIVEIPKIPPFSLSLRWNLLPVEAIRAFVFAPLPYEVRILAGKFPELDKTLKSVGINRLTDFTKLTGVTLNLPGLTELTNTLKNVGSQRLAGIDKLNGVGLAIPGISSLTEAWKNSVGIGKIALIKGLPLANFSLAQKKNLPTEFVFARAASELVDLNVAMSINDQGQVTQQISSLPGEILKLVVKPLSSARSVTGYLIFKSATPKIVQNEIPRSSLTASALFSMNGLVENVPSPVPAEQKLVLESFQYTDPNHDGIYTADVATPAVPGEYEVITVIDYLDPVLGTRQIRMTTVVDPEGYVFEQNNGKETRIPSAIVSLYYLNTATTKYELWPARDYQQENPQTTDIRGTYSFMVPEGSYYFEVEAPGYNAYQGKVFVVTEGSSIHQNIELKSGQEWFKNIDWKTILLIVVFLLLVYNLYRNWLRDKLSKSLNKVDGK